MPDQHGIFAVLVYSLGLCDESVQKMFRFCSFKLPGYNTSVPLVRNIRTTLEMIKWEHSVFALPFALCGAMLAAGGLPRPATLAWIIIAMVSARSAAMAFNRLADHAIDAANARTQTRALPAGVLSRQFVGGFVVFSCVI